MRERKQFRFKKDVLLQDIDMNGISMPQQTYKAGDVYELDKEVGEALKAEGKVEGLGRGRPPKTGAPENKQSEESKEKKGFFS